MSPAVIARQAAADGSPTGDTAGPCAHVAAEHPQAHPGVVSCRYHGWSGWTLEAPAHGGAITAFDPAPGVPLPADVAVVCVTHGHPEHLAGRDAHLRRDERRALTVIGSESVCAHFRPALRGDDAFVSVDPGDRVTIGGWRWEVFRWSHMSLLPPEPALALRHVRHLASRPGDLLRIVWDGAFGPRHGPMFGYRAHLAAGVGPVITYLGEGLHRRTTRALLHAACDPKVVDPVGDVRELPVVLIAGVEPEDSRAVPPLLGSLPLARALLFEPHVPWRRRFGMAELSGAALLDDLGRFAVPASLAAPRDTFEI